MGKRGFVAIFILAAFLFYIAPANAAGCITEGGGSCTTGQAGQRGDCNEGFWCSDCSPGPVCYQVPAGMQDKGCVNGERVCAPPSSTPSPTPGQPTPPTNPTQPGQCPYKSIDARIQKNGDDPWGDSKSINLGETFAAAGFHSGYGVLIDTGISMKVTGPGFDQTYTQNPSYGIKPSSAGTYTLTVSYPNCNSGTATITVANANPCSNSIKDGTETDVDCGGSCPNKCANGKICAANTDCLSALCDLTGPDTTCNRVGPTSQGGRCVTCDGSTKKQSSLGGFGQGCCELACGSTQVCDEYGAESNCIQCSSTTTPINKAPKIEREIAQIPPSINAGETTIINVTYSDEDGANDISSVFFAISPGGATGEAYCTMAFEFPLANYFGTAVRMAQDKGSYAVAAYDSKTSAQNCPWGQQALAGEFANKPGTAKLLGINENGNTTITKSGNQVRAGFKIEFSKNFPQGDYNVYAMVSDSKNAFQTGATAAWDKIGAISVRKVKYSWDFSKTGTCAQNVQCFVEENKCIGNNAHISDHYCLDGEWTSRTKFAALQLLGYAKNSNIKDYTLFCGNYSETANYFEYAIGETPLVNYLKDVNSICILKSDKVIFGAVLNKSLQDSGFLNVLNIESCNGQGLYACDKTNRAWYDSDKRILYYSDSEITLSPGAVEGAASRIVNFFRTLLSGKITTDQNVEFVTQVQDFSKVYLNAKGTRNIVGVMEKKLVDNKLMDVMAVNYSGFSSNICAFAKEAVGGACKASAGRYSLYFSKEAEQQLPNDLFNYWPDLTAKLRIGECLIPKTASECSGTQGSQFCGDENGRFLINGACCSASDKVVLDSVCLTPCDDKDKDNFGVGEMCTKAPDCDNNNGNIRPENPNPFCDCNLNDNGIDKGTNEICNDGIDNDCDGNVDASDSDCILPPTAGCTITDKFCSNNKGVLSLYKESNSNAAVYGKAPLNLCCSDKANAGCQFKCRIIQTPGQDTELLYLYSEQNSHVTYINPGSNLRVACRLEGDCSNKQLRDCSWHTPGAMGGECPDSSYQCIASAYDVQNAHLGPCNYYERNICCKVGSSVGLFTPNEPTCLDNIKNQDETGVDCGGICAVTDSGKCNVGRNCNNNKDCISANCISGKCFPQPPQLEPTPITFSKNVDCETKNYKMAFILLVKNKEDAPSESENKVSTIKKDFSDYFSKATRELASMDTSTEVYTMISENNMFDLSYGPNYVNVAEVSKKFYENHEDIYDFITIFTTFDTEQSSANYKVVQNIKGIGQNIYDNSKNHGSNGKLKSIIFARNINAYDVSLDVFRFGLINLLLHETGHQWCCFVGNNFMRGKDNAKLEIIQDGMHFYHGLQSPDTDGDPMFSDHWVKGEDGFYKIPYIHPSEPQKYHPFQLYFMGLLPKDEYGNKFTIYDAGIVGEDYNRERGVPYKEVTVNDIIDLEGKRSCIT